MSGVVYILCALTSLLCSILLLRGYRGTGMRLLLWSGLCFLVLSLNNVILFIDLIVFTQVDLGVTRQAVGFAGISLLLYGLIWEAP